MDRLDNTASLRVLARLSRSARDNRVCKATAKLKMVNEDFWADFIIFSVS